jgi:hypothetical protein
VHPTPPAGSSSGSDPGQRPAAVGPLAQGLGVVLAVLTLVVAWQQWPAGSWLAPAAEPVAVLAPVVAPVLASNSVGNAPEEAELLALPAPAALQHEQELVGPALDQADQALDPSADLESIVAAAVEDARAHHHLAGAAAAHAPRAEDAPVPPGLDVAGSRQPLRRYVGRYVALWTDCRPEFARELLGQLDSFVRQAHDELAQILQLQVKPKPVQIYVFEAQEHYQAYAREHAPTLVNNGGYYDGALRTVVTYRYNNSMQLYFHELVHAILGEQFADHQFSRYNRRHWPVWFDEGMAEYLGSFALQQSGLQIAAVNKSKLAYLANAVHSDNLLDLNLLLRAPSERFSGASMNFYYAGAWGLVDLLLATPKWRAQVPNFFARIKAGEDGLEAFRACFGADTAAMQAAWKARITKLAQPEPGEVHLFDGKHVWDWTVHEGGNWRASGGEITGNGDNNYNYLIKADVPLSSLSLQVDVHLTHGTAGLILGNHDHREYPYHYLIDIGKDVIMLRRAWSATRIEPMIQAWAEVPLREWVRVRVDVQDGVLRVLVDGREVLTTRTDRPRLSMFGLYLYKAKVRFRNVTLTRRSLDAAPLTSMPAGSASSPAPGTGADR